MKQKKSEFLLLFSLLFFVIIDYKIEKKIRKLKIIFRNELPSFQFNKKKKLKSKIMYAYNIFDSTLNLNKIKKKSFIIKCVCLCVYVFYMRIYIYTRIMASSKKIKYIQMLYFKKLTFLKF